MVVEFYEYTCDDDCPEAGDPCPVVCDETTLADTIYFSTNPDSCWQWPGASGHNSATYGTCDSRGNFFAWDQYLSCDCGASGWDVSGDTTPVRKVLCFPF